MVSATLIRIFVAATPNHHLLDAYIFILFKLRCCYVPPMLTVADFSQYTSATPSQ
ncbi:hypothetical protein GTQ43_39925 [Nostoc sp. KVJ3]|uniref:hypothetical protein n=1 Tax=Nostoc sp. KVJ3 TaxID=457945 RepID=UPI002237CB0F|nr:hypothetical protein [Nostoc sp. KVJ3]MCW5319462.1 hypothetical protein [Nostoc sp. KVJ3]MCW5319501.1 hypothetical protein [Nostoc sp. KVJ3]